MNVDVGIIELAIFCLQLGIGERKFCMAVDQPAMSVRPTPTPECEVTNSTESCGRLGLKVLGLLP